MRVLLIKGLLHLLAWLPLSTVHALATWLGQWVATRSKLRITQVTRTNIGLCFPHWSHEAQKTLITQSIIETCKTFCELGAIWLWSHQQVLGLVRKVSGETYLQQALQQNRGVILLTPHLGAWEMAGLYIASGYTLTALYRPPKLVGLHDFIHQARERTGGRFVPIDQAGIRVVYQSLRQGHVVGILPDQVPSETGIFAQFFGIPAYTMVLVSRLVRSTGATVIFTYAERLSHGQGFHLHFLPAPVDIGANNLAIAVRALNQGVEQCVLACPEQYQWSYKRFKRHPIQEMSIYQRRG